MSSDQVLMYVRRAKHASSPDNQIEILLKGLEQAGKALRELESRVSSLESA